MANNRAIRNRSHLPDYANRIRIVSLDTTGVETSRSGTIDNDGYLQIRVNTGSNVKSPYWRLHINNVIVTEGYKFSADSYIYRMSGLFEVKKGDTYKVEFAGANESELYYYPLR